MTDSTDTLRPEWILAHAEWVHRLARRLVNDAATAADVGQETLVQALEQPPRDERAVRGWLATVARNIARRHGRSERRRRDRERGASICEGSESPLDVQTRAELQRALVECVLELEQPYREVILRRYLDDLSLDELVEQTGRARNTVRSQLSRGRIMLRERWERRRGAGSIAVLAPLAASPSTTELAKFPVVAGTFLGVAWWQWIGGAAVLLALGWGMGAWSGADEPAVPPTSPMSSEARPPVTDDPTAASLATLGVQRERVETDSSPPPAVRGVGDAESVPEPPSADPGPSTRVDDPPLRVVDARGEPVVGLRLIGEDESGVAWHGTTDGLGELRPSVQSRGGRGSAELGDVDGPSAGVVLRSNSPRSDDPGWLIIARGKVATGDERGRPILVAAPAVEIAGRVRSRDDKAIASARVEVSVMREALLELPYRLVGFDRFQTWVTYSGRQGQFSLGRVPSLEGFELKSWGNGWKETSMRVPSRSRTDVDVVLRPETVAPHTARSIQGKVVDPQGRGIAGASVDFGFDSTRSGEGGAYRLRVTGGVQDWVLTAMVHGQQAAVRHGVAARFEAGEVEIRDFDLRLGGDPLSIRGRVLDVEGEPREDVEVFLRDGTMFGSWGHPIEFEVSRTSGVCLQTDAEGRFEFGGLGARDYWILACDSDDLLVLEARAVAAGTHDLVLREPADARTTLRGVVRSRTGEVLDGLRVGLEALVLDTGFSGMMTSGREVVTDAGGRFVLEDAPWRGLSFLVTGDDVRETRVPIEAAHREGFVELIVPLKHRLKLRWTGGAEQVSVLDRTGAPIQVTVFATDGTNSRERIRREEYPAGARCEIDDEAHWIAGYRDGSELWRRRLELSRGVERELDV